MRFTGHTQPQKARPRTSPYTTTTSRAPVSADAASKLRDATVTSKAVVKAVNSASAFVTGADVSSSATEWGG